MRILATIFSVRVILVLRSFTVHTFNESVRFFLHSVRMFLRSLAQQRRSKSHYKNEKLLRKMCWVHELEVDLIVNLYRHSTKCFIEWLMYDDISLAMCLICLIITITFQVKKSYSVGISMNFSQSRIIIILYGYHYPTMCAQRFSVLKNVL